MDKVLAEMGSYNIHQIQIAHESLTIYTYGFTDQPTIQMFKCSLSHSLTI